MTGQLPSHGSHSMSPTVAEIPYRASSEPTWAVPAPPDKTRQRWME